MWRALAILTLMPTVALSAPQSNPAFLGVVMASIPCPATSSCPGVVVSNITPGTPAARAGFYINDIILRIDGAAVQNPTEAIQVITAKHPGDTIDVEVRRGGAIEHITPRLTTRAEVLYDRYGGHSVDWGEQTSVDGSVYNLSEGTGHATVVGFITKDCVGCTRIFARVQRWTRKHPGSVALAIVAGDTDSVRAMKKTIDVPVVESTITIRDTSLLFEPERAQFMVIDGRGEVKFVSPIAVGGDDIDAAVDEVLAAAEQAERPRR